MFGFGSNTNNNTNNNGGGGFGSNQNASFTFGGGSSNSSGFGGGNDNSNTNSAFGSSNTFFGSSSSTPAAASGGVNSLAFGSSQNVMGANNSFQQHPQQHPQQQQQQHPQQQQQHSMGVSPAFRNSAPSFRTGAASSSPSLNPSSSSNPFGGGGGVGGGGGTGFGSSHHHNAQHNSTQNSNNMNASFPLPFGTSTGANIGTNNNTTTFGNSSTVTTSGGFGNNNNNNNLFGQQSSTVSTSTSASSSMSSTLNPNAASFQMPSSSTSTHNNMTGFSSSANNFSSNTHNTSMFSSSSNVVQQSSSTNNNNNAPFGSPFGTSSFSSNLNNNNNSTTTTNTNNMNNSNVPFGSPPTSSNSTFNNNTNNTNATTPMFSSSMTSSAPQPFGSNTGAASASVSVSSAAGTSSMAAASPFGTSSNTMSTPSFSNQNSGGFSGWGSSNNNNSNNNNNPMSANINDDANAHKSIGGGFGTASGGENTNASLAFSSASQSPFAKSGFSTSTSTSTSTSSTTNITTAIGSSNNNNNVNEEKEKLNKLNAEIEEKKKRLLMRMEEKKKQKLLQQQQQQQQQQNQSQNQGQSQSQNQGQSQSQAPPSNSAAAAKAALAERNAARFSSNANLNSTLSCINDLPPDLKAHALKQQNEPQSYESTGQKTSSSSSQPSEESKNKEANVSLIGTCPHMCPDEELLRRQKENDIQLLEGLSDKIHPPHWTLRNTCVKRFRRSAADFKLDIPELIRNPQVLEQTISYLEEWVMERDRQGLDIRFIQSSATSNDTPSPMDVYQFVWDRTRMIRKDFILQNYQANAVVGGKCSATSVRVHERIARWHAMMEHQLSHVSDFVLFHSQQNIQELGQTMKTLNIYYDDSLRRSVVEEPEYVNKDGKTFHGCQNDQVQGPMPVDFDGTLLNAEMNPNRIVGTTNANKINHGTAEPEMRALYILLTMDNDGGMEVLKYAGALCVENPMVYKSKPVQLALSVYTAKKEHNYARFFSILRSPSTPYLFACVMFKYVEQMRKIAFQLMYRIYGARAGTVVKYDTYPLKDLVHLLCFEDEEEAMAACKHFNITVKDVPTKRSTPENPESQLMVLWKHSHYQEAKDPEKGTSIRLIPKKMTRTIESKAKGCSRLAICRGDLSGEGSILSHPMMMLRRQASVSLPSPPKISNRIGGDITLSALSNESNVAKQLKEAEHEKKQKEEEAAAAARARAEGERRIQEEKEKVERERLLKQKQQEEEERRRRELAEQRAKMEAEKQRQLEEQIRKQKELELAEKKRIQEEKERAERERLLKKQREEEERRRRHELELAKKRAEEERLRLEELERQKRIALERQKEKERLEQLRRAEQERKERLERERLERERLAQEQRRKAEEERRRKAREEEIRRQTILQFEQKISHSTLRFAFNKWRRKVHSHETRIENTQRSLSKIDFTFSPSSATHTYGNLSHRLPMKRKNMIPLARLSKEQMQEDLFYRMANDTSVKTNLSKMLGRFLLNNLLRWKKMRHSINIVSPDESHDTDEPLRHHIILCKLAVILPEYSSEKADVDDAVTSWIHSQLCYGNVQVETFIQDRERYEIRTVAVDGTHSSDKIPGSDVVLFVIPPFDGEKDASNEPQFSDSCLKSMDTNMIRMALVLDDETKNTNALVATRDLVRVALGHQITNLSFAVNATSDNSNHIMSAFRSCCNSLIYRFVNDMFQETNFVPCGVEQIHLLHLCQTIITTSLRKRYDDIKSKQVTQLDPAKEEAIILKIIQSVPSSLAHELKSIGNYLQTRSIALWPAEEFAVSTSTFHQNESKDGAHIPAYFGDNGHLPLHWLSKLAIPRFHRALCEMLQVSTTSTSLHDLVSEMLTDAPPQIQHKCYVMIEKNLFASCMETALLWLENVKDKNRHDDKFGDFDSFIYLPSLERKDIVNRVLQRVFQEVGHNDTSYWSGWKPTAPLIRVDYEEEAIVPFPPTKVDEDVIESKENNVATKINSGRKRRSLPNTKNTIRTETEAEQISSPPLEMNINLPGAIVPAKIEEEDSNERPYQEHKRSKIEAPVRKFFSKQKQKSSNFTKQLEALLHGDTTINMKVGDTDLSDIMANLGGSIKLPSTFK